MQTFCYGCLVCSCFRKQLPKTPYQKMLSKGSNNIEKELNIVKIIKDLKNLRILMRSKLSDELVKKEI